VVRGLVFHCISNIKDLEINKYWAESENQIIVNKYQETAKSSATIDAVDEFNLTHPVDDLLVIDIVIDSIHITPIGNGSCSKFLRSTVTSHLQLQLKRSSFTDTAIVIKFWVPSECSNATHTVAMS
jgi:hypothetical protein